MCGLQGHYPIVHVAFLGHHSRARFANPACPARAAGLMMESGRKCPDCGSSNVVEDDLYSQPQLVCTDCGSVVSEGQLTTTRSEEVQGTGMQDALNVHPCDPMRHGVSKLGDIYPFL